MSLVGENLPARKLEQDAGNVIAAQIRDKMIAAPATAAKQDNILTALGLLGTDAKLELIRTLLAGTLAVSGPLTNAQLTAAGLATDAKLELVRVLLAGTLSVSGPLTSAQLTAAGLATDAKLELVRLLLAGTLTAAPSADQDPIFDETNGQKVTLVANTAADVITPPAGCKFVRFTVSADTFIATDNPGAMSDNGKNTLVAAGQPEVLPVTAGLKVRGLSTSAAVVRAMPLKVR